MIFENLNVRHKSFGDGVVTQRDGKYITVKFNSAEKKFVYPDVFDGFLTLADGTVCDEILADIGDAKKAKQVILDKKNEENLRAMMRGIVIPGKEANPLEGEDEEGRFKETEEV